MATPIDVIYSKFLHMVDDVELAMIDDEEFDEILIDYLENSTVEFFECEKDLTIIKPSSKEAVLSCGYEADGVDFGVKEISQIPKASFRKLRNKIDEGFTNNICHLWEVDITKGEFDTYALYYLQEIYDPNFSVNEDGTNADVGSDNTIDGVDYERVLLEENVDYKLHYSEDDGILYIASLKELAKGEYLFFSHIAKGYIKDDLELDEIQILAYGMLMSWLNPKIRREENLRQTMRDRDFSQLSIANMLGKLLDLSKHTKAELTRYKQRYAYKNFKGFD